MAPFPVERQLILNRLGETSLNSDVVGLIKEFTFESVVNWCIRVEAERMKRLTNTEFEKMKKWRTTDNIQWVVNFDVYASKSNVKFIKEIGASNCPTCGNYIDHLFTGMEQPTFAMDEWGYEDQWIPSQQAQRCAPRAICECPGNWYDNTVTQNDEEEFDAWYDASVTQQEEEDYDF
jgi:hypothetical protein